MALGISGAAVIRCDRTLAQIVPDNTLGAESSQVQSPSVGAFQIDGGATRGTNLFHSFQAFSVPTNGSAYFNNSAAIQNIISRVIGSSISTIDGTLRANGTANLFLINPSGIIFGANAKLNLGGSFLASTASSINFADGTQFSAIPTQAPPLLTVSIPIGLQYGANNGSIRVEGAGSPSVQQGFGLRVAPGRTLALLGGNVSLNGGILQAPGGQIELGGLAGAGTVGLSFNGNNPSLSFPDGITRADLSLANSAVIDVTANTGGDVFIYARNVELLGDSNICAGIGPNADCGSTIGTSVGSTSSQAGNILIDATDQVSLSQSSRIANNINPNATGNSADIFAAIRNRNLFGSILVNTGSLFLTEGASLSTSTFGNGNAGIVYVQARDAVSLSGFQLVPGTQTKERSRIASAVLDGATGNAGGILIETGTLSLTNFGFINSSTYGRGIAGDVVVRARGDVSFVNSDIFSNVESGGVGNGGQIDIEAASLSVLNGSQLQTGVRGASRNGTPAGQGSGGNVTINVRDRVTVGGVNSDGFPGAIFTDVESGAVGNAGDIDIRARSVDVSDRGRIDTSISGAGEAGSVLIRATDSVTIARRARIVSTINQGADARSANNQFAGNIFGSSGDIVGSIFIDTGTLTLTDNAILNASTLGVGNAGAVLVQASDAVSVSNDSAIGSIVGSTARGDAGGVLMSVGSLSLNNGSLLTTSTLGDGDAGLIIVVADEDVSLRNGSGILSTVEPGSTFTAGGIGIRARALNVRNGSSVSVDNQGTGEAGAIEVRAREDIFVLNDGEISATTLSGQGGDIELEVGDFLVLLGNSNISTEAGKDRGGGNGGNIRINTDIPRTRAIFGIPVNDSNITANAYTGAGGSIRVNAARLYEIDRRPLDPSTNDINASSTYGREGEVEINDIDIDPNQALTTLPRTPIDVSRLITQRCPVRGTDAEEVNKFTVTGRGGLPPNPNDTLQNESGEPNWVTPSLPRENRNEKDSSANPNGTVAPESRVRKTPVLVEAQGWVYGEKGEIILTAQSPTATPRNPLVTPTASCNAN